MSAISSTTEHDPRWPYIVARDKAADGTFWYSVVTTGVYCRPSCPSRTCRPNNVAIHDTLAEARATGCRACLRCRPDDASSVVLDAVAAACRLIATAEETPRLAALAAAVGFSPSHLHRVFKAATGLTPRAYAEGLRVARVGAGLGAGRSVTEAMHEAGFSSSGRFYETAGRGLGMTPSRYRRGGVQEEIRFAVGPCTLGTILVASTGKGVVAILIGDDPDALLRDLQDRFPHAELIGGDAGYESLVAQVVGLVEAPQTGIDLPLDIRGTAFQQRVWQALRAIPAGRTESYTAIAARIGAPNAVRAVAGACAANALAIAIPCHRVVRTDGALSGYRWGVERKRILLERETAAAPTG